MLSTVYDISTYLTTPSTSGGLSSPSGAFYSSEDADSYPSHTTSQPKREGAFYVWSHTDFTNAISNDRDAAIAAEFYNVREDGNVDPENDIHNELKGQNVLCIASSPEALAKKFDLSKEDVANILKDVRRKLRTYRDTHRPRPALDDKIIVSWNGLAISALARTSSALEGVDDAKAEECRGAAIKATKFIKNELWDQKTGQLWRVWREGRGETKAFADDYAFLIQGLCDLYEATWDDAYLQWADELMRRFLIFNTLSLLSPLYHFPLSLVSLFSTPPSTTFSLFSQTKLSLSSAPYTKLTTPRSTNHPLPRPLHQRLLQHPLLPTRHPPPPQRRPRQRRTLHQRHLRPKPLPPLLLPLAHPLHHARHQHSLRLCQRNRTTSLPLPVSPQQRRDQSRWYARDCADGEYGGDEGGVFEDKGESEAGDELCEGW